MPGLTSWGILIVTRHLGKYEHAQPRWTKVIYKLVGQKSFAARWTEVTTSSYAHIENPQLSNGKASQPPR